MTKNIYLAILLATLFLTKSVYASYSVPGFEGHMKRSKQIVVGKMTRLDNGEFYFVIEESLKGDLIKNSMAILNQNSLIAWYMDSPGGPRRVSRKVFSKRIVEKDWYGKRVILLGEFKDGLWVSSYLDHSVWSSGESTGEDDHKALSLQELIEVIRSDLKTVPEGGE